MTKYVPIIITQLSANESAAVDAINSNLNSIKENIDDSISRSAKTPSQMLADLDLNGHKILNIGKPTADTDLVRLQDVVTEKAEIKEMHDQVMATGERILSAAEVTDEKVQEASDAAALAEAWATKMDGPVDGGDYSAKYYAEQIGADVATVAAIATDVSAVAAVDDEVTTVAGISSDVTTVAGVSTDVSTVASNATDIGTVASDTTAINTCATNIAAIINAPLAAASCMPILFDHKWTDYEVGNMSWLRADIFSWQDGTVYTNAYNHLVEDIDGKTATTETVAGTTVTYYLADDGHKIVDVDDVAAIETVYSDTGAAWYYVLDTTNQRFKLPRENPSKENLMNRAPVVTGSTNNIPSGNELLWTKADDTTGTPLSNASSYSVVLGANASGTYYSSSSTTPNSGGSIVPVNLEAKLSNSTGTYKGNKYLYFYVGQFTQTATEQTAGLNAELFNGKADIDMSNVPSNIGSTAKSYFAGIGMPSDTYENLTLGSSGSTYTAPANGYFVLHKQVSGTNQNISFGINLSPSSDFSTGFVARFVQPPSSGAAMGFVPCKKGDIVTINYSAGGTAVLFRFYYAEGES